MRMAELLADDHERLAFHLAAGPGASLTIAFSGNNTGDFEVIVAQGHDI